jgi:hypothetical protein
VDLAADFLARCLENLRDRIEIHLIVKLHPVYDQGTHVYRDKLASYPNVSIYKGNEGRSTLELLASADAHLSISSATHYDALALGVPTIVLKLPSYETVLPLIENGHVPTVSDPHQLAALLVAGSIPNVDPKLSEYFCKPGAVGNMLQALASLDKGIGHA